MAIFLPTHKETIETTSHDRSGTTNLANRSSTCCGCRYEVMASLLWLGIGSACFAADLTSLRPAAKWLETERLRGVLFHQPNVEPFRPRLLTTAAAEGRQGDPAPVTLRGWHHLLIMPDADGKIAFRLKTIETSPHFTSTIYAVFDSAGEEVSAGLVGQNDEKLVELRFSKVQRQKRPSLSKKLGFSPGPYIVMLNSGPASGNTAQVTVLNRHWSIEVRSREAYSRTPLHYHFLRDLKLGGFNLAMIDVEKLSQSFVTDEDLAKWTALVKRWADYARKHKLRIMPAIDLGGTQYEVDVWSDSPKGLYIEHKEGQPLAPCPLQKTYWERILLRRGREIAELSLENPYVVGYGIDPEMYRCWSYGHYMLSGTCFCDYCLGGFLKRKNLPDNILVEKKSGKARHEWLVEENLMSEYDKYLEEEMCLVASWCRDELHKINPDLMLCVYVLEISNWFCRGLARGLGEKDLPVINFCEHTYYSVGYDRPWLDRIMKAYRDWGANVLQGSAVWDMHFPPTKPSFLAAHAYNLAVNGEGWWYWPGDRLYRDWTCTHAYLNKPAYFEDYWEAATWANREIEKTMQQPGRSSPLDTAEPVPWRGKYRGGKWQTDENVLKPYSEPKYPVHVAAPTRLYFSVPERTTEFEVNCFARRDGSPAVVTVRDPQGRAVGKVQGQLNEQQSIAVTQARPGIWSVEIGAQPNARIRDVGISLGRLPAMLSPSPNALLVPQVKKPGLIGYWPLDEGKGPIIGDKSQPPALNGSLRGGEWVEGKIGAALAFDGKSGGVSIPVEYSFHNLRRFTVSAWVKLDALPEPGNGATIINKGPEAPVQHFWWWIGYPPNYPLTLELGGKKHRWGASFASKPLKWELGRWYHVASVCESDGQKTAVTHYRDGERIGTSQREEGFHSGTYDIRLGTYGGLHWIDGAIDEVKIWDRPLTIEDIRREWKRGTK